MIFAVIDTNVWVSALLTHHIQSATFKVMEAIFAKKIIPLYNEEIIREYTEVLHRPKFGFAESDISHFMETLKQVGIHSQRVSSSEVFPDSKDVVFYEVALSKEDAYLVTGNTKHFPKTPIVVTPAEIMELLMSTER
jgi:putative PIN family toxin of toxin-antitoxin system